MKTTLSFLLILILSTTTAVAGEFVTYTVNGEKYEGYYARATAKAPLVLLVHDWDGLNDYEVKRSDMLAMRGYTVFAVDMYGAGVRPAETAERRKLTSGLYKDREKMRRLMYGALEAARAKGADTGNAAAMGYCFGGAVVLEFARSGADMKGFVTFHGGLKTPEGQNYSKTRGKVLILHGSADTSVPVEHFAGLAVELEDHGVPHEMILYSGAPHAFTDWGGDRYREDADKKSWLRFTEFLGETL